MKRTMLIVALVASTAACKGQTKDEAAPVEEQTNSATQGTSEESPPEEMPESSAESGVSAASGEAISARVEAAQTRLSATEGGKKVWASIEAAGGLTPWFASGKLKFRFAYKPVDGKPRDTIQTIDTWSSLARHQMPNNPEIEFGWDGNVAWINPPDGEINNNARFWSLTPYYFVGIPFVLADPGTNFEVLPDAEFEGKSYDLVKATFDAGTGDAPDDYYIVYLDKETKRVRALRYVVSYKGFNPDGGHGPEKLMSYDGNISASGLTFAATHRTFKFDEETGKLGKLVTNTTVSDVEFVRDLPEDYFQVPEGAKVIDGWK